jgi:hypothetical protein
MLTRVLMAWALICGLSAAALAQETKVLAFGLGNRAVTEEQLAKGETPPVPRFNSPGVAYVLATNLKRGDSIDIALVKDGKPLMHNSETLSEDRAQSLLQAGKQAVPAGGWPEGEYQASVKITRDGKTLIEQATDPIPFE